MRIGIYTQPLRFNYGGILQAWALQTVLRRMGHEVVTFDPYPYMHLSWKLIPFVFLVRTFRFLIKHSNTFFYEQKYNREFDIKMKYLRPFIDKNINVMIFHNITKLNQNDYDALIVGSDQVWRPKLNNTHWCRIENSFLDFAEKWKVKRIAYAVSFGTDKWEYNEGQTIRCAELAKHFDAVSVREGSGITICKEKLGIESVHVLDPTMLLQKEDYISLINNGCKTHTPNGQLLCYILDNTPDINLLINKIAETKHLCPFQTNSLVENPTANLSDKIQPPVEQWLRDFMDAEFVVTDSFHACVFSILFNKPFVVLGNKQRGMSRFQSLLSMFDLKNHLLYDSTDYQPTSSYDIPPEVYKKLSHMRSFSYAFLETNLLNI